MAVRVGISKYAVGKCAEHLDGWLSDADVLTWTVKQLVLTYARCVHVLPWHALRAFCLHNAIGWRSFVFRWRRVIRSLKSHNPRLFSDAEEAVRLSYVDPALHPAGTNFNQSTQYQRQLQSAAAAAAHQLFLPPSGPDNLDHLDDDDDDDDDPVDSGPAGLVFGHDYAHMSEQQMATTIGSMTGVDLGSAGMGGLLDTRSAHQNMLDEWLGSSSPLQDQ
ncbi:hypothetical protein BC831DRAFT_447246 [Entophlyctis helioformis]|nr:hypothetical protein BC831DRAFT_447246 [Entophlyctis helioformis]